MNQDRVLTRNLAVLKLLMLVGAIMRCEAGYKPFRMVFPWDKGCLIQNLWQNREDCWGSIVEK